MFCNKKAKKVRIFNYLKKGNWNAISLISHVLSVLLFSSNKGTESGNIPCPKRKAAVANAFYRKEFSLNTVKVLFHKNNSINYFLSIIKNVLYFYDLIVSVFELNIISHKENTLF